MNEQKKIRKLQREHFFKRWESLLEELDFLTDNYPDFFTESERGKLSDDLEFIYQALRLK